MEGMALRGARPRSWGAASLFALAVLLTTTSCVYIQGATASASAAEARRLNKEAIARVRQGNLDAAIPLAERALALRKKELGSEHPRVALYVNNLAELHRMRGDHARATSLHERALAIREEALGRDHPLVATSLDYLARTCSEKGDHARAAALREQALVIRENALGPEHPWLVPSLKRLAALYDVKGERARAVSLHERALVIQEKTLGPEHPNVATTLNDIALLHDRRGNYTRAEPLYRRALAIREKTLGPDHLNVAQSLNNLARMRRARGDYEQAESLYKRALAIREKVLGPEHFDVATSLNNLASLYNREGDYARAEALHKRALAIREKALGPEHPDVATSLNDLALLYHAKGKYAQAEALHERALAIQEKALGPEHPNVATSLNNLASLYQDKGQYTQAEALDKRALAIREKTLGPEHPNVAISLNKLASLYRATGKYARAEPLYERALAIQEKTLGPEHPDVARSLNNLAALYHEKGDKMRAEPLYERALAIRENVLGPEHRDVATSLNNLALLYYARGKVAQAEPLYERALAIQEKALGPEHPEVATSLNNLACLYRTRGDNTRAELFYERALAMREKALGPEHPKVATSLNNLALLYRAKGEYARAEPLYERALAMREKALGPEHPDVAQSLRNLAFLHQDQGDIPRAIQRLEASTAIEDRNAGVVLSTGGDEQKRAYMATFWNSTRAAVSFHVQLAPNNEAAKRLAITTILRRKGRVLDAMAHGLTALRRRLAPEDRSLLDRLSSVSAELSAVAWRGPVEPRSHELPEAQAHLEQYRAEVARLDADRQRLEAEISRRSPAAKAELSPVTLAQVQDAVPEGAALVEFFRYQPFNRRASSGKSPWGKPRYAAYVIPHRGDVAWADLGEASAIRDAVHEFRRALARAATDPRPPARALDALVMQPLRRALGPTRRVLLSPDSALNLVPFSALVDEDGRYLVERYLFTYLTSGRDLLRLRATAPARQGDVVVAAPAYDGAPAPAQPRGAGDDPSGESGQLRFPPLASASEEGRAIGRKLPAAQVLLGSEATEAALKALHGPRLLHVVTHGFFLPDQAQLHATPPPRLVDVDSRGMGAWSSALPPIENPLLRSGLAFAGANLRSAGENDGLLTALEASQLDLNGTQLVVLAACETGVGDTRSGDGVYGLRRALVMAGAETQVMSLWNVSDNATHELMQAYYDRLLAGGGRGESMRDAQRAMLASPERAHPFYWASFIVAGDDAPLGDRKVDLSSAKVRPSHGCGCDLAARPPAGACVAAALLAACTAVIRHRRGARHQRHVRVTRSPAHPGRAASPRRAEP
ncbi:tetratricopeptide repeat protein [Sorangium sp. So ce1389]|uniref:CHAT domain-containing tetratricopeptide repeat protein n=1 Tax=Sorangium sp. So ce1389 TaxID=3133336 RepID=UPI003F5F117A